MSSRSVKYAFQFSVHRKGCDPLDPQAVGAFLDALIDERREHVTVEEIKAAARKRDCPLHDGLTWDDLEAAEKWRSHEAKSIMRNLMVEKHGKRTRTRAFVHVAHPDHGGKRVYLSMQSALARPEFREQVKQQIVRRWQRSLGFYSDVFAGDRVFARIAKDVEKLMRKAERDFMAVA